MDTAHPSEKPQEALPHHPMENEHHTPSAYSHPTHFSSDLSSYEVKTLLSWSAPGRPYKKRGKEYFTSVLLITGLLVIIVFLFSEYPLMMVILSFSFVILALALVPPHNYRYRISTEGISIEDHFYLWQELYDFYFTNKEGEDIVHIHTKALLPGELLLTLGTIHKEQVKNILLPYLPYRETIHKTFVEKSGTWLSKTFPLEKLTS